MDLKLSIFGKKKNPEKNFFDISSSREKIIHFSKDTELIQYL